MSKVQRIKVQNLKAVSELEASFNGCTAIITGGNNKGKSTFLRSLPDRLRGIKPSIILKENETEGFAEWELTTGEILRWEFDNKTKAGERLKFITVDKGGNQFSTSLTKELAARFFPETFDVDDFLQSMPQAQTKTLQKLVGIDFTLIDSRHKAAYEDRTFANKNRDIAKVKLKPVNKGLKTEENSTEELETEIAGIELHNQKYNHALQGAKEVRKQEAETDIEIKRLNTLLKAAEEKKKSLAKRIVDAEKWLNNPDNKEKDEEHTFQLNVKLQKLVDENELIAKNNQAIQQEKDYEDMVKAAKDADKKVKDIEQERRDMIKDSNMPVGFGFDDDGNITYNDLPFTKEQQSTSGIYIAALKLASMTLGEVKVLHFDASALDKENLLKIEEWASINDLQVFIERARFEGGEIEFDIIEEIK